VENIKLLQVLGSLTREEINSLGELIKSSYFNKSQDITRLYGILKKYYPKFDKLNKDKIFSALFSTGKYKDKKLRDLFSKMLGLVEEFLILEDLKNYPLEEKRHILNQYSIRNLDKHYEGVTREMQLLLDKIKVKESDYFYSSYLLKKDSRNYFEQKTTLGKRGEFYPEIRTEIDSFVLFFIYKMLRYFIEQINQQKLYKHEAKLEFIEQISGYISVRNMENEPQLNILYTCLIMLMKPGESHHYLNLKKLLEINRNYLNKDDLKLVYIQVYNFTREKYFEGNAELRYDLFEIIKQMIFMEIYPQEQGYMTSQTFISFVSAGLAVKELEWTFKFMENFLQRISPSHSENTYKYCMALYNYRKGNMDKALELLSDVKIEDFYFYLRVKNQTSKIYFELGEYESLLSLLDTFRHYITSTESIPEFISKRFTDYIFFLKKVVNARLAGDESQLKKLQEEIKASAEFENKTWLLEKI